MKSMRSFWEKACRNKRFKRRILVNNRKIPLYVSPDSQLKYLKPGSKSFDTDLITIAETFLDKEANVWDIGANIGVFSFSAAAIAVNGTILAVEADIWLADLLRKSAQLTENISRTICVLPAAISDSSSIARFHIAKRGRASNALEAAGGKSQMGGVREQQYVATLTLDSLLEHFPAPVFVKIDIEGAELMAIRGAEKLVSAIRPIFYIEVSQEFSQEIAGYFAANEYVLYSLSGNQLFNECAANTFFIPRENEQALQSLARMNGLQR